MRAEERAWRERGLLRAVLAGDERAWQAWYEECYDGLYAYVCWRCAGRRDRAEEIVQETWLTAVRRVRTFDPDQGSFAGWLRGIAANLLRNHFRRAGRLGPVESLNGTTDIAAPTEKRDAPEWVAQALSELPARYEAALRAKYLDRQSVAEIAAEWNETPKAVESLLSRARQAFREAYLRLEESP
jgi:RNA polymerase sigma-70 factor (ECF subfamily)